MHLLCKSPKIKSPQPNKGGKVSADNNITKLVGIKGIKLEKVEETEDKITITGKCKKRPKTFLCCGSKKIEIHDHRQQNIRDLPYRDKQVILKIDIRRFKCRECGKRFTEDKPFVSKHCQITKRLKRRVLEEFKNKISIKDIAKKFYISPKTVSNIIDTVEIKRLKLGEVLNIDEFKGDSGGEKYQTIIADSQNKKILDVLPTRKFDYLDKYFSQIPKEEKDKVKIFVSDMYRPYRDIKKKHFPNAKHLIDRYHFIRQVIWGFENTRISESKKMKKQERIHFMRSKSLLTKPMIKLEDDEKIKVSIMLERNEEIRKAYLTKKNFYNLVIKSENKEKAQRNIQGWIVYLLEDGSIKWRSCLTAFKNWIEQISNSFDYEFTNGYVEGMNNKIKVLKRKTFGMKNFKRFRNRILALE